MEEIISGVYIETGYSGVTLGAIVRDKHVLLIDSPIKAEDVRTWRSSVMNLANGNARFLVNLDGHVDRTIGSKGMDCVVIAHEKTSQSFRNRPTSAKPQEPETGSESERCGNLGPIRWAMPEIVFSECLHLEWGENSILLEHHPGSSPGATWIILPKEKLMFVGDAVIPGQPPFLAMADITLWQDSLRLILDKFKNYIVIGGRSGAVTHDQIRLQIKLLQMIQSKLATLSEKKSPTDSIEQLIPSLLAKISDDESTHYYKRLRWGIKQYYQRHHLSLNPSGINE